MQCSPGGGLRAADALRAAERLRPAEGLRPAAIALPRIWSIEDSVGVAGQCMLTATGSHWGQHAQNGVYGENVKR